MKIIISVMQAILLFFLLSALSPLTFAADKQTERLVAAPADADASTDLAAEDVKAAFLGLKLVQTDFGDAVWRIVEASDYYDALGSRKTITEGFTTSEGVVRFSKAQRKLLYTAWQKAPKQLWFIINSNPSQMLPEKINGQLQVGFLEPESADEKKDRLKKEQDEIEQKQPLLASAYTQQGFDAKPFLRDFADWQKRFKQDLSAAARLAKKLDMRNLTEAEQTKLLNEAFTHSIDSDAKGLSLRALLLAAPQQRSSADPGVFAQGDTFTLLVTGENAKPVGYGGEFTDNGKKVELWYMTFDDMKDWTVHDLHESLTFKQFNPAELPPYKTIQRDSWPTLVFVRGKDGKVMMYGLSKEMAGILQSVWNAQIF